MSITASMVKELRERTGAGMMECKKALTETAGDMDAAVESLRKSGLAKADKKASRIAAEGTVAFVASDDGKTAAMVEINCETDFVAKGDEFKQFATDIATAVVNSDISTLEDLSQASLSDGTVEARRQALVAKLGENMTVRRFVRVSGNNIGMYVHGGRIGVLTVLDGGDNDLARDIAMHVAASKPEAIDESGVSQEMLDKEKEIFVSQARESGKPDDIIEKMITGRMKKFVGEITLVGQPFVKDPDVTVGTLLANNKASIVSFERFEVGEGIEKKSENFADEVMAQIGG
jgi:elongation factor Ts